MMHAQFAKATTLADCGWVYRFSSASRIYQHTWWQVDSGKLTDSEKNCYFISVTRAGEYRVYKKLGV